MAYVLFASLEAIRENGTARPAGKVGLQILN